MKQVILDTNAIRYFYQIECCNGEGVRDKVMRQYYFDQHKYIQFLRTVSSINIPATTKFELFFQAYRKGEADLLFKYNELTQHYKETYGVDIFVLNSIEPDLKFDQVQLAEDIKSGYIQTELYIKPRIEHEVKLMHGFFIILIGTLSDVLYKNIEIDRCISEVISRLLTSQMHSRLQDLYNQYYLDMESKMCIDDVDAKIDKILLESIRDSFILINTVMRKEHPESSIEDKIVSFDASSTSEYLRELLQLNAKYTKSDYYVSLDRALDEMRHTKDFAETEIEYLRYLLQDALNGSKRIVHKNDMTDYTIITMLNEKSILKVNKAEGKKEDFKLITFDRKMYEFSKQNNVMYDEKIYNEFLFPQ